MVPSWCFIPCIPFIPEKATFPKDSHHAFSVTFGVSTAERITPQA